MYIILGFLITIPGALILNFFPNSTFYCDWRNRYVLTLLSLDVECSYPQFRISTKTSNAELFRTFENVNKRVWDFNCWVFYQYNYYWQLTKNLFQCNEKTPIENQFWKPDSILDSWFCYCSKKPTFLQILKKLAGNSNEQKF